VVKLLLDIGKADVSVNDSDGGTPLSRAAQNGNEAVVKLLLETGRVDIEAKDNSGRTALAWAREKGHEAVARLLQLNLSS
jgi:ankyrin repeat protein